MSGCHNPGRISYAPNYGNQCTCGCHYGQVGYIWPCCDCKRTTVDKLEISALKHQIKSLTETIEKIKTIIKELSS